MRFFNSVKSLYSAVGILFLAFSLGYYLDVQNQAMDARHLEVNTLLERTVRLEQELSNMLSLTVVEQNELRATRYETVRQEAEASIKRLIELTKGMGVSREISAVMESQKNIVPMETVALEKIRADQWKEARDILLGDEYVSAKKIYEIESEAIPGLVRGEIEGIEKRFGRIKSAVRAVSLAALCLLLWTGIAFSHRTSADMAEQVRLRTEISNANEQLEERVRERTKELESTLQKINASEEALKQAAREQEAIFESLTLGIAFVKDRIILRGNAKLGELFGRPLDEMIGQTTRIWYKNDEEYLGIGASTYEDLKRQPIHQREQELPRKDGSLFWCLFRVRALDPQDISQGIVCTLEDITERKIQEQKLAESERRLELALWSTNTGLWEWNAVTGELVTNATWSEMLGYDRRELDERYGNVYARWEQLTHPEDLPAALECLQAHIEGKIPEYRAEFRMKSKSGEWIWILDVGKGQEPDADGKPTKLIGTHVDITGRKKAEEKLRLANFLSDQALDLTKAGHWHIPLNTGDEYYNSSARAAAIFGDPPRADWRYHLMNEWFANVEAGDKTAAEATFKNYGEALAGKVPRYDAIYAYKRPIDGRVVWIHAMGHVVRDAEGKPTDMYGVTVDVTERKQAEVELNKRMDELERFMRLTINREKKMIQLKAEINTLLQQTDKEQKYKIVA